MAGSDDENPPPPPPQTPTQQAPHTVSTIKLPILKKGEYDIWAMKMEHYLSHTDYFIWGSLQKEMVPPYLVAMMNQRRWGGNTFLKQQFEGFLLSTQKDATTGYDRFQSLLSQLEIHGAGVSTEDANQKFLRSLPSSWSQVSLVMRTKPGVDSLSFDDLYNNLRVFESDVKGSTGSSSHNSSGYNSQRENSSSYTDELMYSFFANQSSGLQLDHEDLEQLDEFDLEEMDLKWQVAMISMRLKKFYKKTGRRLQFDAKEPVGFDKTKVECFNCHKTGHFARECISQGNQESRRRDAENTGYKAKDNRRRLGKQEEPKALVTHDGEGFDWTGHAEDEQENFALMAYSNSGSDTKVKSCSKECVESYAKLKKLYDEQREQLGDASIEIKAYTLALAKMSAKDKSGLGYGNQVHEGVLSYENEVFQSVFDSRSSDVEDSPVHDRFANVEGMHAVPPPMIGNYMPPGPDREYESDSDDDYVIQPSKEQEKPSFAFVNTVKHVKTPRETVKEQNTYSPKTDKRDWNGLISKRMAKQVELKKKGKGTSQGENRPVWNNTNLYSQAATTRPFNRTTAPKANFSNQKVNTAEVKAVSVVGGKRETAVKPSAGCNWRPKRHYWNKVSKYNSVQLYNGRTGKLDCEDVCFVKELRQFNLFSVSQMCDKKNKVLFTNTECLVLSPNFKLLDENQVLLKVPRQNNMYSFNIENIVPSGGLACLIAKATVDESNKWHRRLGHVNFKNLNKLVKRNLVRGLPSKIFQNDHTCVACQKGKQHKASCKAKLVSSISQPLQLLHMDLFGPTFVRSINHKTYCLVITDDFRRFSWVFFVRTKDETSGILKDFIRQIENQLNQKVKTIRCDNGIEFKNRDIIEFCGSKGIKREYSNARTPQ
ncbi:putative ribonuclease H-like domain-containing protein [Tanacetum coccineum]